MWIARAAIISAAFLLSACATGPRIVASDVRTTAAQPPGAAVLAGARYRFERGPQAAGQPAPERLEAMAQAALARVGLERDDARARLTVQVSGTVSAYWMDDWGRPQGGPGRLSFGLGMGRGGFGLGLGGPLYDSSVPLYISEASVLMRDLQTGQIVYDSRARHDGPWHDTENVLAALFVAALQGYPNPPQGVRRVDVPLLPPVGAASAPAAALVPAR